LKLKAAITLILLFASLLGTGQVKNDGELWTGTTIKFDINKRFRLDASYQYRSDFGPFQKKQSFGQIGLRFKVAKWFLIRPSYRLTRMPDFNDDSDRFALDFILRGKYSDWKFKYRFRTQYHTAVNQVDRALMFRSKVTAAYNLSKKIDPVVSWEMFSPIETGASQRIKLGVDWRLKKSIHLNIFYGLEKQMNRKFNDNTHIFGLLVGINTGIKKKKEWSEEIE